jgi:hypothetical protein
MPMRFPFRRAGASEPLGSTQQSAADSKFEKAPVAGTKPRDVKEPVEYKLSGMRFPRAALRIMHALRPCKEWGVSIATMR